MSDGRGDRPALPSSASAGKCAYTDRGTNGGTNTERGIFTRQSAMSDEKQKPSGKPTRKTRGAHESSRDERIEDPAAVAVLAAILGDTPLSTESKRQR